MLTSTVLTLVVIPAIYSLWKEREVARHVRGAQQSARVSHVGMTPPAADT
jgi:hypothetical protein